MPAEEETRPDWVLSPDSITPVIVDLHLVEGARIGRKVLGDTTLIDHFYDKIWQKHGLTRARFDSNFRYYSQYPKVMDGIYDDVIEELNKMEANIEGSNRKGDDPEKTSTEVLKEISDKKGAFTKKDSTTQATDTAKTK